MAGIGGRGSTDDGMPNSGSETEPDDASRQGAAPGAAGQAGTNGASPDEDVDETMAGGLEYPDPPIRPTGPPKRLSRENAPFEDGDNETRREDSTRDQ